MAWHPLQFPGLRDCHGVVDSTSSSLAVTYVVPMLCQRRILAKFMTYFSLMCNIALQHRIIALFLPPLLTLHLYRR